MRRLLVPVVCLACLGLAATPGAAHAADGGSAPAPAKAKKPAAAKKPEAAKTEKSPPKKAKATASKKPAPAEKKPVAKSKKATPEKAKATASKKPAPAEKKPAAKSKKLPQHKAKATASKKPAPAERKPAAKPKKATQEKAKATASNKPAPVANKPAPTPAPATALPKPDPSLRTTALVFFQGLSSGVPDAMAELATYPFDLDGEILRSRSSLTKRLTTAFETKDFSHLPFYGLEMLPGDQMVKRYGPPPARLGKIDLTGTWVGIADFGGHGYVAVFKKKYGRWLAIAYTD